MHSRTIWVGLLAVIGILLVSAVFADVPRIISYQGRLKDSGGVPYNGSKLTKFTIYNGSGTAIWNTGFISVSFDAGLCAVKLGESPQPALPTSNWTSDTGLTLGITVDVDPEISPRTRFTTVGYAMHSRDADKLDGQDASVFATLAGNNVFTGSNNQFQNDVRIDGNIGIKASPNVFEKVYLSPPDLATGSFTSGYYANLQNSSTGGIYAIRSRAYSSMAGSGGGIVAGVFSEGRSDGPARYGLQTVALATNASIATGDTYGVFAEAYDGATAYGVYGYASSATTNWAGYFSGNLHCSGILSKAGGAFRIDHPLDPESKILQHSFVESPDMMNVYNGNAILDFKGEVLITLPTYFEALNRDFRYQLTAVGAPSPNLYVAKKISNNQFQIAGGSSNGEISWQVTGIRKDKWAEQNRVQVEIDKLPDQKGLYLNADVYGLPTDKSVDRDALRESEKRRAESAGQKPE